jgi:large subunit ribosomal protein L18
MKLDKRRRIENKTNYHKRLILLKGKSPRLVIRKTNKYVILQIIESKNAQDKVVCSVSTKDLLKSGWPKEKQGSLKSISAAYLAGLILGKKAGKLKDRVIVDTGLIPNTKGSRIYAAVKGVADSGIEINYDEKVIPKMEKIEGKAHKLEEIFKKVKGAIK